MFKHTILLFLIATFALTSEAQSRDFLHIDVRDYKVVDSVPVFTHEIKLGELPEKEYDVKVLYPEYATLTPPERQLLKQMLQKGRTDGGLHLQQHLTTQRKEHGLSVSFSPIVLHEGRWKRLSSCKLELSPRSTRKPLATHLNATVPATRWKKTSVLATGRWAKVRVSQEGIYCLTPALLQQMGFSDLNRIKVYGYGGRLQPETFDFSSTTPTPDDLVEVPTIAGKEGRLFWAEGTRLWQYRRTTGRWVHTNNHYSSHSYYFVTEGDSPAILEEQQAVSPVASIRTIVPYAVTLDEDKMAWYEGGRRLFDAHNFANDNDHSFSLALPDLALNNGVAMVNTDLSFTASSSTSYTSVDIKVGNMVVARQNLGTYNSLTEIARADVSSFATQISAPSIQYDITTTAGNNARLDYIRVNYPRELRLSPSPFSFSPQGNGTQTLRIVGATPTMQVWQLARGLTPTQRVPLTLEEQGSAVFTTANPSERFVAFDAALTYAAPEYVGTIAPQNLHADEKIDYVILVPASGQLVEQAERLAQLHRNREGLMVKVVKADELYNEFSSGTPDANAYRRYLKMLYDRANTAKEAPKYLLLMGKSPWDCRLLTERWKGKRPEDYLLPYEADDSQYSIGTVHSYVSDDFFAMLDDKEGNNIAREKLDLAVGRMVATTAEEAQRLVDKVELYLSNKDTGAWKSKIVMLGDDGDANEHMEDADQVAAALQLVDERLNVRKIYWDSFARHSGAVGFTYPQATAQIHEQMKSGAVMFNYSGHGAPHQISHEKVLGFDDFRKSFSPHLSLWVVASCEIYPFDAYEDNLGESSLYLPDGGSIAFMCATRAVYASPNAALNAAFSRYVVGKDAEGKRITMGEALRLAKNKLVSEGADMTINKLKYVLFGDPALTLAIPTERLILDKINGKPLQQGTQLSAGSVVHFEGYVAQPSNDKAIDTTFDGNLEALLYDRQETIKCKDNDGSAQKYDKQPFEYQERTRQVFEGSNVVKEGRFEFTITIPRDISYSNDAACLQLYAVSQDKQRECSGVSKDFHLNGTDEQAINDVTPPKVVAYLNSPDTPELSIVGVTPTLIAHISDDSGINTSGSSLGHDIELVLDDNNAEAINLNRHFTYDFGSYQKGTLTYPLNGLSIGAHRLSLRVWDVNNNPTTTHIRFIVRADSQSVPSMLATTNPASTSTTFVARWHPIEQAQSTITFEVFDVSGRRVWTHQQTQGAGQSSTTFTWNLHSSEGIPLPEGIYLYRAVISNTNSTITTDTQKLIISRL